MLEKKDWVTNLLLLLPMNIVEIMRETELNTDNHEYVKQLLLKLFKLSEEAFKNEFKRHQRRSDILCKDLVFELQTHLEG